MNNKDLNHLLHGALYAGAATTDAVYGGGGQHMRRLADELYGPKLTGVHDTATCRCDQCTWAEREKAKRPRCILHPDEIAVGDAQGIPLCSEDYRRYQDERRQSDGQFLRRPFLQSLIKASADRNTDTESRHIDRTQG